MSELPSDNAMRKSIEALLTAYNPVVFDLGQANAKLALGNLQLSRAQTMIERQKMLASLTGTLQAAGLELPATLSLPKRLVQRLTVSTGSSSTLTARQPLLRLVILTGALYWKKPQIRSTL